MCKRRRTGERTREEGDSFCVVKKYSNDDVLAEFHGDRMGFLLSCFDFGPACASIGAFQPGDSPLLQAIH